MSEEERGEFERTVLDRLDKLESEVERLKFGMPPETERMRYFESLPDTATVGKDSAAYRFGCSEEAVLRGRYGTHTLRPKRVSQKPLKFIKRDVDAAWREYTKPVRQKAAEVIGKPVKRKRLKSIINMKRK
jgi:hypothetical protein